jgi:hypothetical protein
MNWLKKWMAGRYGCDQLSILLLILSVLPILTVSLSGQVRITYLTFIPLVLCIYRALSKQLYKRRFENERFLKLLSSAYSYIKKRHRKITDFKNHKHFKCPNCKQRIRIPKGEGTIIVVCSNCYTKLKKKT